jgi:streptogramin lyase
MNTNLVEQLRLYGDDFTAAQEEIRLEDLADRPIQVDPIPQRSRRGWVVAFAAAIVTIVVVGGALLIGGPFSSDQTPVVTQPTSETFTTYTGADGLLGNCGCDMAVTPDGTVWLIGPDGISHFDGLAWSQVEAPQEFFRGGDLSVNAGGDGVLWFTGGGRAVRYDQGEWTIFAPEDIEAFGPLYQVVVSDDGTAWGIEGDYTVKLQDESFAPVNERFETLPTRAWDEENPIIGGPSIAIGPDGTLWVSGTPGDLINRLYGYDGSTVQVHDTPGAFTPQLLAIAPDNSAWLAADFDMNGSDERLMRFDGVTWTTFRLGGVIDAAVEPDGTGWFIVDEVQGSDRYWRTQYSEPGAYRFDGETWTRLTTGDGLAGHDLTSVVIGSDGSVWFGTYSHGVTRYQPGTDPEAGTPIELPGELLPQSEWPSAPVTTVPDDGL